MTERDLDAIQERLDECLQAVNRESNPMGRALAWSIHGAPLIRQDIPALITAMRAVAADVKATA